MSKNDEKILQLRNAIKSKKEQIGDKNKRFTPVTNCILDFESKKHNLNALQGDELILLLVKLNALKISMKDLDIMTLELSGYNIIEWITDIRNRIQCIQLKNEENKLKTMEKQLEQLLSDEKKTELAVEEIEKMLGNI